VGDIRIGVSGWSYKAWRESFFPRELPLKRHLDYITGRFNTLEINGSFYSLQRPDTYRSWYDTAPRGFLFAVKGSRFITHNKKLGDAEAPLANFFASGVVQLAEKLGPILWQLPDTLRFVPERVASFLELLPKNTVAAAALARKHDHRFKYEPWLQSGRKRRIRHALEVRQESFATPELAKQLRRHRVALVVADSGSWPRYEEITADFLYVRLHGSPDTYASRYSDSTLDGWAERIRKWSAGGEPADAARISDRKAPRRKSRDVFVYFDNDQQAHAPHDALRLAERLGVRLAPDE
jgi:uncharacterized protein YecE (DUF72 family)